MGVAERKIRQRAARERRITKLAREIAEREGWSAVTIRRLADEIEYSQPVIYAHFENKDAIVAAVAIEGFGELATALQDAAHSQDDRLASLHNVASAYLGFAGSHPALYDAMFTMPTTLRFADVETKPELRAAFLSLKAVIIPSGTSDEVATETLWAALHGLAELERSGRIRPSARDARVSLIVNALFVVD